MSKLNKIDITCYIDWIKNNVKEIYGKCEDITEKMQTAFPELNRIRGYYDCPLWGKREH